MTWGYEIGTKFNLVSRFFIWIKYYTILHSLEGSDPSVVNWDILWLPNDELKFLSEDSKWAILLSFSSIERSVWCNSSRFSLFKFSILISKFKTFLADSSSRCSVDSNSSRIPLKLETAKWEFWKIRSSISINFVF